MLPKRDAFAQTENPDKLLAEINRWRKSNRLQPLRYEPRLGLLARQMAEAVARGRKDGIPIDEVEAEVRRQGYAFRQIGYLLGIGNTDAKEMVTGWITENRPDEGVMNRGYTEIGTAMVDGRALSDGKTGLVWVSLLADPTRPAAAGWDRDVLKYVNAFRASKEKPPLRLNAILSRAAQAHAQDMARRDYFDHNSPEGRTAGDRAQRAGYRFQYWRENLAVGQETPKQVVDGWIRSRTGHREAMLDDLMKEVGIGYAFLPQDGGRIDAVHYWAMTLASPRQ